MDVHGRVLVLVNPKAVRLRRSGVWEAVRAAADGEQVVLVETRHAGHAKEYARAHADAFDKVIAVGGDGLLMDVVNGVMGADVAVAPLPAGSGSDFAKVLPGYPVSLEGLLASRRTVRTDVGKITFVEGEAQYFLSEAGTGLDAACVRYIPDWVRPISSARAYDLGALQAVLRYKPCRARVTLDDEAIAFDRLQLLAVCNTRFFGDGMPIAPDARFDDGVFHVFAFGGMSRLGILRSFTLLRKGEHIYHPETVYRSCRTVRIEADRELAMCVDGDLIERTPRAWEILPGALRVVVPESV